MIYHTEAGSSKGKTPALVLLHGFCEDQRMWHAWRRPLAEEYHILCPDLPGCGKSDALKDGFSLSDVAQELHRWLSETVEDDQPVVLVGHSLGGYVALAMLEQKPERFAGFGMFHSTAYADTEEKRQSRNNVISFVEKYGVAKFAESFVPQLFRADNRDRLKQEVAHAVQMASETPAEMLKGYTRAMQQRPSRISVLEAYKKPILYLIGQHDTSVSLEDSKRQLIHLADYEAHILQSSGHVGMYEQEKESQRIVKEFVHKIA